MVNSAGLSTMQPVGSRPGPKAFTYVGQERGAELGTGGGPVHPIPVLTSVQELGHTLSGKQSGGAGWMWAMKGESRMSSSSQMTCTAYSPGSVGQ